MKGFIGKTLALGLSAGFSAMTGCCGYYDVVDPCYPARYSFQARREVCEGLSPQCKNGHALDQTVFNWYFKPGTDELLPSGQDKLLYLLRRRPCPDQTIYLATAQDVPEYDPKAPQKFVEARNKLDTDRAEAVRKYLEAQTVGRGLNFQVLLHDPAEPGMHAVPVGLSVVAQWFTTFRGSLAGASGAGGASVTPGTR